MHMEGRSRCGSLAGLRGGSAIEEAIVISKGITLKAGDIIATGTPAGVGAGFKPPRFLKHEDVVSINIEPIGTLTNRVA